MDAPSRAVAEAADRADPLAAFRRRFVETVPDGVNARERPIYLDGNSLGRLPRSTSERLRQVVVDEWGTGLVRSWDDWIDRPQTVGDKIGTQLLGARAGEVLVADSTTVNLYKLAAAALSARPDRSVILTTDDNFPTDRYVLEGLAAERGRQVRTVAADPVDGLDLDALRSAIDQDVALVALSQVAYRSGAVVDPVAVNEMAHAVGALTLWDLSHAVGCLPVDLTNDGTDLAAGCSYKYLHGGPGAPAWLYVRREHQTDLQQPIWGWFGQRDQFAMADRYDAVAGIGRFASGTPPVLALAAVEEGVAVVAEAGVERVRTKAMALTSLAVDLVDCWLAPIGATLASPRDAAGRGAHVSLAHPEAYRLSGALTEQQVVVDVRPPDRVRLGLAPLTTSFVDVWDGLDRLRRILDTRAYESQPSEPGRVT